MQNTDLIVMPFYVLQQVPTPAPQPQPLPRRSRRTIELENLRKQLEEAHLKISHLEKENRKLLRLLKTNKISLVPAVNLPNFKLNESDFAGRKESENNEDEGEFPGPNLKIEYPENFDDDFQNDDGNNSDEFAIEPSASSSKSKPSKKLQNGPDKPARRAIRNKRKKTQSSKSKRINIIRKQLRVQILNSETIKLRQPGNATRKFVVDAFDKILTSDKKKGAERNLTLMALQDMNCNKGRLDLQPFQDGLKNRMEFLMTEIIAKDPELGPQLISSKKPKMISKGPVISYVDPETYKRNQAQKSNTTKPTNDVDKDSDQDEDEDLDKTEKTKKKVYPCKYCKKIMKTKYSSRMHIREHEGIKPFMCDICGAAFVSNSSLTRHLLVHSKKSFPCDICKKLFARKEDVKRHVTHMHTNPGGIKCSMCPATLFDNSGLRKHERSHFGIKPFMCSQCGKFFAEKRSLNVHMNSLHGSKEVPHRVQFVPS